jgi:thymidylate kinase
MTSARREFLLALFRILHRRRVPYCVLRNYAQIYDDASSDVDLIVEQRNLGRAREALTDAAAESGHRLVHRTRYVNHSFVYWSEVGGFLRVDVDTEIRWRVFPILSAAEIVRHRRKEAEFHIPHPAHEAVVLLSAAVWRGALSDRYRRQLARLRELSGDGAELARAFKAAFGRAGGALAPALPAIRHPGPNDVNWGAVRASIILNTFQSPKKIKAFFCYLASDLTRLWQRLRSPAGLSLFCVSHRPLAGFVAKLQSRLDVLFPVAKSTLAPGPRKAGPGFSPAYSWQRLRTVFRGGLFVSLREGADEGQMSKTVRPSTRCLFPERAFVCANFTERLFLGHVDSGFIAELPPDPTAPASETPILHALASLLAYSAASRHSTPMRGGIFVVLVGPDGSGKTTIARQLCCSPEARQRFQAVRYFHWLPALRRETVFPLPEPGNLPRKPAAANSLLRACVSALRLAKNLAVAWIAYGLRVRPLLRRNSLVLLDRYFYNYYLDPVSVKYYGPKWLLDLARPLFPRPDLVAVFTAPTDVLLARKQELSPREIERQTQLLARLPFIATRKVLRLDASLPPRELADQILGQTA